MAAPSPLTRFQGVTALLLAASLFACSGSPRRADSATPAYVVDGQQQVADHIEHARRVAGIEHVAIGSDFDGMYSHVEGLEDASGMPALFAELHGRGWSAADLARLAHGNFLRVLRNVEAAAAEGGRQD